MADIRINSLPTTASASSSDDFLALDGATNGTRKLNAYSPTFGGNVTASGNLTVSGVTTSAGISNSGALTFTAAIGQVAGSIAKNATYGLTYYGVTGSSNDNTMLNASGAVVLSNPAGTTNATLAGNLTVSGTGTSSFGGVVQVSNTLAAKETNASLTLQPGPGTGGINYAFGQGTGDHVWYAGTTERMRLGYGGNLLIGTTTDSGNGKLQLATHTTSAGGIGFGTDTSLYRSQTGMLALDGLTGSLSQLDLRVGGVQKAFVAWNGGDFYLGAVVGTTVIRSSNTTALTLDSSQNATFNGTILASSATGFVLNLSDTRSQAAGNGASIGLRGTYTGSSQTNFAAVLGLKVNSTDGNYAGKMVLQTRPNGGALTDALTLDDSQNATFAGTALTVDGASTGSTLTLKRASNANGAIISYKTTTTSKWYHGLRGLVDDNWYLQNDVAGNTALFFDASTSNATFAGTVTTTGLITVTGTTASIANGATADITLNTPSSLVSYYVRSEGNSNDQSSGFYRSNNNGASSAFVLFGQSEANVAVTTPAAGTIRITNNTGGTIAFAYAFTVLVKR